MIVQRTANAFTRPGIYFHDKTPSIGLDLPPLDVAAFVGFAERGPLDIPVAVEDVDTFRSVFGSDLALARRSDSGRQDVVQTSDDIRFASLPSAVAHFFANGGRRCYVVRVAGPAAVAAQFCLPGVVSMGQLLNGEAATSPDPARYYDRCLLAGRVGEGAPAGQPGANGPAAGRCLHVGRTGTLAVAN